MQIIRNKMKIKDLIRCMLLGAAGIASKIIITPLVHMITGPLWIPGGVIAGGFYMFWLVFARAHIKNKYAGSMTAFFQALMVLVSGSVASHGIISIITYTLPGIFVDLSFAFSKKISKEGIYIIAGILSNLIGFLGSNILFFNLPIIPLFTSTIIAMFSGSLGGLLALRIENKMNGELKDE